MDVASVIFFHAMALQTNTNQQHSGAKLVNLHEQQPRKKKLLLFQVLIKLRYRPLPTAS